MTKRGPDRDASGPTASRDTRETRETRDQQRELFYSLPGRRIAETAAAKLMKFSNRYRRFAHALLRARKTRSRRFIIDYSERSARAPEREERRADNQSGHRR